MPTRFFSEHTITRQSQVLERKHPHHSLLRRSRALPAPATQLEHFKPLHVAATVAPQERARRAIGQAIVLARAGHHDKANEVLRAAGVTGHKTFLERGIESAVAHPVGALRSVTGIDLTRVEHPVRAYQHDAAPGKDAFAAYKRGEITLAEAQKRAGTSIGVMPFGPKVGKLLGKIPGLGRGAAEGAAAEVPFVARPRTRPEAERRLAYLDRKVEGFYNKVGGRYRSIDPAEQARRNVISGKAVSGKGRGALKAQRAGVQPTLSSQFDEQTAKAVERVVAHNPEHPAVKKFVAAREEANQLREALNAKHLPGETAAPQDYGQLTKEEFRASERYAQRAVRTSLQPARGLAAEQKKLYSAELSARVARGQSAAEAAGGGSAGHQAFMAELRGSLPKVTMDRLQGGALTQEDLDTLARHLDLSPDLQALEKVSANEALRNAVEKGAAFRPFEIKLLQRAFGTEATKNLQRGFSPLNTLIDTLNVPRSIMASFDVSAPMRQGITVLSGHPRIFAKSLGPMFKSLVSEPYYKDKVLAEIHARPNAPLYEQAGVRFTELRGQTSKLREEQFSSDLAERIPGVGHVVRASGRAYTGFLDKARADVFDSMIASAQKKGINTENPKFLRSLGKYVNATTGRGEMGRLESWAPALNAVFFAPRLIASRVNFLNPYWYFKLDPFVRRQALKSIVTLGSGATLGLALAGHYTRATVGTNPLSADFAKLKINNTRFDVLGGFQQYVRLAAQLQQGKIVSSTTGKTLPLGHGFGQLTQWDILERFAVGKFSPPASMVHDFFTGTTFAGQPFTVKQALLSRIIPLVAQDVLDLHHAGYSIPLTALGYGISAFGIGMQTYGPKPKGNRSSGGSGGSSSILRRSRSTGGSLLRSGGGRSSPSLLRP